MKPLLAILAVLPTGAWAGSVTVCGTGACTYTTVAAALADNSADPILLADGVHGVGSSTSAAPTRHSP